MDITRTRLRLLLASIAGLLLFSACTPEQLQTYEQLTGNTLDQTTHDALINLDDAPIVMPNSTTINVDGSVVDCVTSVNSLAYSYDAKAPVMQAFQTVALCRGWSQRQVDSWKVAVGDIAGREAHFCWNVRYNARFKFFDGRGCVLSRPGSGAAGYGQITSVLYHITCSKVNLCSGASIVASPYNSMLSLVALIEDQGVSPWCYNRFSRNFHRVACGNPGLDV